AAKLSSSVRCSAAAVRNSHSSSRASMAAATAPTATRAAAASIHLCQRRGPAVVIATTVPPASGPLAWNTASVINFGSSRTGPAARRGAAKSVGTEGRAWLEQFPGAGREGRGCGRGGRRRGRLEGQGAFARGQEL